MGSHSSRLKTQLQLALCCILLPYFTEGNDEGWISGNATLQGDLHNSSTMAGACGYVNLYSERYGGNTSAVSGMLFNSGLTCGACFEIRCVDDTELCLPGNRTVTITATDFCPPHYGLSGDGWCNPPRAHFEMAMPAFQQIAIWQAGIVPIQYRRGKCQKVGGVRFTIHGNRYFYLVLVTNVGSDGDVVAVQVKGSQTGWIVMTRNWGQNWQCDADLRGQALSFQVTTSDGKTLTSYDVVPPNWQFGQTFEGKQF